MEAGIQARVDSWLNGNYDDATKDAIRALDEAGLVEAFYKDLEFGTGGLRGIMGAGTNRMNKYTVARATQGFSNYLKKNFSGETVKVAIAYDSRNQSDEFADVSARVFSENGIEVYLFEALRPTPELSFTIRHLGLHAGIVLTASHNPKEYNGYKAYWQDGGQVISPHDKGIIDEVNSITDLSAIPLSGKDELIHKIGRDVDEAYLDKVASLSVGLENNRKNSDLKIVYTSIHGTGITMVPEALKRYGFENVSIVKEQETPDGNFPTVVYPNPEESEALTLALKQAKDIDADLVLATDPDADRVGIALKNKDGEFELLNGNQTGSLLIYYLLNAWQEAGKLTGKEFIVKTIVTSELIKEIADNFKVKCYDVLTGFKYIAGIIEEQYGKTQFIGGGEESYGYLAGDFVRDKDAVIACCLIAEALAWAKSRGISMFELLVDMYTNNAFYLENLVSLKKEGKAGVEEIQQMMEDFRSKPPKSIGGSKIITVKDYRESTSLNTASGEKTTIDLPKSNVIQFFTEDGSKITARPSGTEPKIKFYIGVKADLKDKTDFDKVKTELEGRITAIKSDMGLS